jgi:hypothetical protein
MMDHLVFIKSVRVACAYDGNDMTDMKLARGLYKYIKSAANNLHRLGSFRVKSPTALIQY